jgi:hypothetical protein
VFACALERLLDIEPPGWVFWTSRLLEGLPGTHSERTALKVRRST